jgi:hypothetical protein
VEAQVAVAPVKGPGFGGGGVAQPRDREAGPFRARSPRARVLAARGLSGVCRRCRIRRGPGGGRARELLRRTIVARVRHRDQVGPSGSVVVGGAGWVRGWLRRPPHRSVRRHANEPGAAEGAAPLHSLAPDRRLRQRNNGHATTIQQFNPGAPTHLRGRRLPGLAHRTQAHAGQLSAERPRSMAHR